MSKIKAEPPCAQAIPLCEKFFKKSFGITEGIAESKGKLYLFPLDHQQVKCPIDKGWRASYKNQFKPIIRITTHAMAISYYFC